MVICRIPFWVTVTLTYDQVYRIIVSGAYLLRLYYKLLSSNVSYAKPIPLGAFVTLTGIIFGGDSERFAHFLAKNLIEFGMMGEKSHNKM